MKNKKSRSTSHYRSAFASGIIALSLIALVIIAFQWFKHNLFNLNNQSPAVASMLLLDQNTGLIAPDFQENPDAPKKIFSQLYFQNQSQKKALENVSGYGIAAGGKLTYLSQEDLNQYFDSLNALGVQWVRWDANWSVVERSGQGVYDWEGTDRVAETANRYGINSLVTIDYAPRWASDKTCKVDSQCAPVDPSMFANFAGKIALRYRDSISYWEIWNEPNFVNFWGPKPNVKIYAEALKKSYVEIKKSNPAAFVLSGGLAPSANEKDGSIAPVTFMKGLYAIGANQYFDAVALHPYSYPASPQYQASWNSWQQMYLIRQLMVGHGDSFKKIWVTEFGAPTGGSGSKNQMNQLKFHYGFDYMSEAAQKDLASSVITLYKKDINWMGPFFWYSLHDNGTKKDTPENFFGLLRYDWSKKPAYDVFKNAIFSDE